MTLVRLACPDCGADLPAPAGAVLFPCRRCGRTLEAGAGRLRRVPTRALAPVRDPGGRPLLHLPCWCFGVANAAATPVAGLPPRVVVPSLAPTHGGAFLRLARSLSRAAGGWETAAPGDPDAAASAAPAGALPGRLGVADALALAETVALACVPGAVREGLLAADPFPLRFTGPDLAWVPCVRRAARCEDLVVGVEIPVRLLADAEPAAPAPAPSAAAPARETAGIVE